MSLLTYESKVSDLLMQNFELGSLMMTNHDLLTYWLAPQVKRISGAETERAKYRI